MSCLTPGALTRLPTSVRLGSIASLVVVLASGAGCLLPDGGSGGSGATSSSGSSNTQGDGASYSVDATETDSTCGEGSLSLEAEWTFDATLDVDEDAGTVSADLGTGKIVGTLGDDGKTFDLVTTIVVDMRAGTDQTAMPPCSIKRTDTLTGTLDQGDALDPTKEPTDTGFSGVLTYHFEPTEGSDCEDLLLGETPLVTQLPCDVAYDVTATEGT